MNKFKDMYKTIMEEVEAPFDQQQFEGVIINPIDQTIKSFKYTKKDIDKIRAKMVEPYEEELVDVSNALLLWDSSNQVIGDTPIFSLYDEPDDLPCAGIGYIIQKSNNTNPITVDMVEQNISFGTADELM